MSIPDAAAAAGAGICLFLTSSIGADELARESAVLAAAARQQIDEHLDAAARARGMVACVGINPGDAPQSPSREFLSRLGRDKVVRTLSECEPRPKGAVEATTLRPAWVSLGQIILDAPP